MPKFKICERRTVQATQYHPETVSIEVDVDCAMHDLPNRKTQLGDLLDYALLKDRLGDTALPEPSDDFKRFQDDTWAGSSYKVAVSVTKQVAVCEPYTTSVEATAGCPFSRLRKAISDLFHTLDRTLEMRGNG